MRCAIPSAALRTSDGLGPPPQPRWATPLPVPSRGELLLARRTRGTAPKPDVYMGADHSNDCLKETNENSSFHWLEAILQHNVGHRRGSVVANGEMAKSQLEEP